MKVVITLPIFDGNQEIISVSRIVEMQHLPPVGCELIFDLTCKDDPGSTYDNLRLEVARITWWHDSGWFIVETKPVVFRERRMENGQMEYADVEEFIKDLERNGWNSSEFFWACESST